jgi:alpha-1,2-mannosyltransferase
VTASGESMADTALARPGAPAPTVAAEPAAPRRRRGGRLLVWGAAVFAVSLAVYLAGWAAGWTYLTPQPLDLQVYIDGGLIVRHLPPLYDGGAAAPLYDWSSLRGWMFTYTPFAAVAFAAVSFIPWTTIEHLSVAGSLAALAGSAWLILGPLGYPARSRARAGAALLAAGVLLWTEPVQRTLLLGQVNLVLMLLILLDLCVPDPVSGRWRSRWWSWCWKGAGIGIAAGIKLVPLVFIPYLLLTRRFRQAAVAAAVFCATIALGFAVIPRDSTAWWLDGLFLNDRRTGFPGVMQNQSLNGIITRFAGSVADGRPAWLVAAVIVTVAGVACAVALHRAGQPALGILACALTGLLVSPISWDHHWVWAVPGLVVLAHFAIRAWRAGRRRAAAGLAALTALIWGAFAAWPIGVWDRSNPFAVGLDGLIWAVPNTPQSQYTQLGDQPWFPEYHYKGLELIGGNLYILTGLVLFALLAVTAVRLTRLTRRLGDSHV